MQPLVFLPHPLVVRRPVLQIVPIAVLLEIVPFRRHLGRRYRVIVFRIQIVAVILGVDFCDVLVEFLERFYPSVVPDQ